MEIFKNSLIFLIATAVVGALSGCGGGGDSETPSTPPVVQPPVVTPPSNDAPTISGLSPSYSVNENAILEIAFTATDPQGDSLTISVTAPSGITYTHTDSTITITAPAVLSDTNYVFTLVASDGVNRTTKEFVVTVKNVTAVTAAPVIEWSDYNGSTNPYFLATEQTADIWGYQLSDEDSSDSEITVTPIISFLNSENVEGSSRLIDSTEVTVDKEVKEAKIKFPNIMQNELVRYSITLEARDNQGNISTSHPLIILVSARDDYHLYLRDYTGAYPVAGETTEVNLNISAFVDSSMHKPVLESVTYVDSSQEGLMNISDINGLSFKITPDISLSDSIVQLNINYKYYDNGSLKRFVGQYLPFKILGSNSIEHQWLDTWEKIDHKVSFANEYEKLSKYFNDALFLSKKIDYAEYQMNIKSIEDSHYNNITSFINRFDSEMKFYFMDAAQSSNKEQMQSFIDFQIEKINFILNGGVIGTYGSDGGDVNLLNEINILNSLTRKYGEDFSFTLDDFQELSNGNYSFFIGNSKYGSYDDAGTWIFNENFNFMTILM